jgi:hypothetical protein
LQLDAVEDHQRRRMRLIPDEEGNAHEEASWEVRVMRRAQHGMCHLIESLLLSCLACLSTLIPSSSCSYVTV